MLTQKVAKVDAKCVSQMAPAKYSSSQPSKAPTMQNKALKTLLVGCIAIISSNTFGYQSVIDPKAQILLKNLVENTLPVMIKSHNARLGPIMRTNQGNYKGTNRTINYSKGKLGQVNFTTYANEKGKLPPVIALGIVNLEGSDFDKFKGGHVFDISSPERSHTGILYYITKGATGMPEIDNKYIYLGFEHGKMTDTNVSESLNLQPPVKCYSTINDIRISDFSGDNSGVKKEVLIQSFTDMKALDIKNISPYLALCQKADINVNFKFNSDMRNAVSNLPAGFNDVVIINSVKIIPAPASITKKPIDKNPMTKNNPMTKKAY